MHLGTCVDGRELTYDESLYEFHLGREIIRYQDARDLDDNAHIRWSFLEQRDWFRHIDSVQLEMCQREALIERGRDAYDGMTPEEQVQADAARDDSVLAGKIVDADPALVQAVADALEAQGLLARGNPVPPANPLGMVDMPSGMEALSQLQRQPGQERRNMTPVEALLMKKILRDDDKTKARREKEAGRAQSKGRRSVVGATRAREKTQESPTKPSSRLVTDAIDTLGASQQHHRYPDITDPGARFDVSYTDSQGNLIHPQGDAVRPDMNQTTDAATRAEAELIATRRRNLEANMLYQMTDVPGMQNAPKSQVDARINGRKVNVDGSIKTERFKKFLHGLGEVVDVLVPAGSVNMGTGGTGEAGGGTGSSGGMKGGRGGGR